MTDQTTAPETDETPTVADAARELIDALNKALADTQGEVTPEMQDEYEKSVHATLNYLDFHSRGKSIQAVIALRGVEPIGVVQIMSTVMRVWAGLLGDQFVADQRAAGLPEETPPTMPELAAITLASLDLIRPENFGLRAEDFADDDDDDQEEGGE